VAPSITAALGGEEQGVPGVEVNAWYGVFAPAGTPAAAINRIHQEINAALKLPDVRDKRMAALARNGCRFDDFQVATPICQPIRASLKTGRLHSSHGLQMTGRELSLDERTFVRRPYPGNIF